MAKQKIVVKKYMEDAKKRSKAMQIAAGFIGVISASLDGEDKIVVIGEGVDPVCLTTTLRKKMGNWHLDSVTEVVEKKDGEKKEEKKEEKKAPEGKTMEVLPLPHHPYVPHIYYEDRVPNKPCCLM